ncbi:PH domain-containing protein [Actinomadura sp. 9N407]|uniref:PH domain-containing protein n=1 Tax=Actinomadura sp. 9N407 TaxID=3375154 RepID=UPI0037A42FFE
MNPGHEQQPPQQPQPGFAQPPPQQPGFAQPGQPPQQPGQPPQQPHAPVDTPPPGYQQAHAAVDARPGYPADKAFALGEGRSWAHISKRFTWQRRISVLLTAVPVGLIGALVVFRGGGTLAMILWAAAILLAVVLAWIVAELAYRSYGYAERGDDLIVMQGVFVKRLIVVPYGRMQFVDVTANLLERWMGIATVRMHTAAAATDAQIPGLPSAEAAQLRDRLAQKGEERSMGL